MSRVQPRASDDHAGSHGDWEDAKLALAETGSWIKNADSKVTILAAVLGVSITTLAGRSDVVISALREQDTRVGGVLMVAVAIAALSVLMTVYFVGVALTPRTRSALKGNRFSWPALAANQTAPESFPTETRVKDAWEQTHALACIAQAKYTAFGRAMRSFLVFVLAAAAVLILSMWLQVPA